MIWYILGYLAAALATYIALDRIPPKQEEDLWLALVWPLAAFLAVAWIIAQGMIRFSAIISKKLR